MKKITLFLMLSALFIPVLQIKSQDSIGMDREQARSIFLDWYNTHGYGFSVSPKDSAYQAVVYLGKLCPLDESGGRMLDLVDVELKRKYRFLCTGLPGDLLNNDSNVVICFVDSVQPLEPGFDLAAYDACAGKGSEVSLSSSYLTPKNITIAIVAVGCAGLAYYAWKKYKARQRKQEDIAAAHKKVIDSAMALRS